MNHPFFSIIIPTYNNAHLINYTIDSVLCQTNKNYELIIVDDGSNDDTETIVANKINSFKVIKYFRKENGGVSSARNLGVKHSKGKYLIFLDSDDILVKESLQDFYSIAICDVYDIIFSDVLKINKKNKTKLRINATDPYGIRKGKGLYLAGAFCIKNTFFNKINGYDENIKYGENTELKFRIDVENPLRSYTNKISMIYYDRPTGESKNLLNKIISNDYIIEKHKNYFIKYPKVKQLYYQNNAIAQIKLYRYQEAKKSIVNAWLANKKNSKTFLRMLIIQLPFLAKKIWK